MAEPLCPRPSADETAIAFAWERRAHEFVRATTKLAVAKDGDFARATNARRLRGRDDALILPVADVARVVVVAGVRIGHRIARPLIRRALLNLGRPLAVPKQPGH